MPRELPLLIFGLICLALQLAQYWVSRRVERQEPGRYPPVPLPSVDWPYGPGSGRHRLGDAPDAWAACHTTRCAHLTTRHSITPAGLVCDECDHLTPGGPMHEEHDGPEPEETL
ncbi:hypothetical protein ACWCYZ_05615 [Streptomyces virginiae]